MPSVSYDQKSIYPSLLGSAADAGQIIMIACFAVAVAVRPSKYGPKMQQGEGSSRFEGIESTV